MKPSSSSVDAHRQPKNMHNTVQDTLETDLDFLNIKEVAEIMRVAPISIYRLVAKRAIPVYRACRKLLFKKKDVIEYLENKRTEPPQYGSS